MSLCLRFLPNIDFEDFSDFFVTSTEKFSRCQKRFTVLPKRVVTLHLNLGLDLGLRQRLRLRQRLEQGLEQGFGTWVLDLCLHFAVLCLSLWHKEILVSQVPIIQGRGTKSKLAFYVSNRYDTILILCFCMTINRPR